MSNCDDNPRISPRVILQWVVFLVMHPRDFHSLRRSLPGMLIGAGLVFAVGIGITSPRGTEQHYRTAVAEAMQSENTRAAELYLRRLIEINAADTDAHYKLAMTFVRRGNTATARQVLRRIAPLYRTGTAAAHLWLAQDVMGDGGPLSKSEMLQAERDLRHCLQREPEHPKANLLLGKLLLNTNRLAESIEHLKTVAIDQPEIHMTIARAYHLMNDRNSAKRHSAKAALHFQKQLRFDYKNAQLRLLVAESLARSGQFLNAESTLRDTHSSIDTQQFQNALVGVYILQADAAMLQTPPQLNQMLISLQKAIAIQADHPQILNRLSMVALKSNDRQRAKLQHMLKANLTLGHASATVHLLLGAFASLNNDSKSAILHFELGLQQQPKMTALMNNLAWSLAHAHPPRLDRALKLANTAVAAAPQNHEFLDTRGEIHLRLGRWQEAVADLERGLPHARETRRIHRSLATAYENLGQIDLAEKHRQLAGTIER